MRVVVVAVELLEALEALVVVQMVQVLVQAPLLLVLQILAVEVEVVTKHQEIATEVLAVLA